MSQETPTTPASEKPAPDADSISWELGKSELILIPVRNMVLFPGVVVPISLGRRQSIEAAQEAMRREASVGLLLQLDPAVEEPKPAEVYRVGTVAAILRYFKDEENRNIAVCAGQKRFEVLHFTRTEPFLVAEVRIVEDVEDAGPEVEARAMSLRQLAIEAIELLPQRPAGVAETLQELKSAPRLADIVANYMDLSAAEKQEILETFDLRNRLDKIAEKLADRVRVMRLAEEINERTRGTINQEVRERYLREQLRTIQKELGEADPKQAEIAELTERIKAAQMPEEVEKQAMQELARLERMPEAAAEYSMIRTYLDWLVELPWSKASAESIDLSHARQVLDEDHYDLEKVKRRILEFLAVRKLKPDGKSPILCLVGPPGVGKTSLGKSIARATGREFVRISLGGCHDEAEIRGHRRTYIGALPGNVIQGLRRAGTRDPVFMLDEIDKMSPSFHGDPYSALLEVLDPEQNTDFRDNYLGLPFDLSRVFFITTANVLDTIPSPVLDRCEVIRLPGYTEEEKLGIARRYLVPKQIDANGLRPEQISFGDDALRAVIRRYTREAGCRNLEREIGGVCRAIAARVAAGEPGPFRIDAGELQPVLGPPRFENEVAMRTSLAGVATALAWTPHGGDILFIEATRMPGTGQLILTGQLGEVMKESAQAAWSLAKATAPDLTIPVDTFKDRDLHVHVPAGAIPKDGPSAGVAIFVAIVSLLTRRKVRHDVAMTGEISLRGLVLPVGGIKEKTLAAHAAGIRTVLLPARNRKDFEDIPESVRSDVEFVWLETVQDALDAALSPSAEPAGIR